MFNKRYTYTRWAPLAFGMILLLFTACQRETADAAKNVNAQNGGMHATTIRVDGMVCVACAARVKELLKTTPGVGVVELNLEQHVARVQYDPAKTSPESL